MEEQTAGNIVDVVSTERVHCGQPMRAGGRTYLKFFFKFWHAQVFLFGSALSSS